MILSESEAKRMFGDENPIGKTIIWKTYRDFTFTIKSVIEDPPQNSSIQYKGLITESSVKIMTPNYPDDWGFGVYETYILLHPNVISSEF
jgi:putative ABC transport system permease protein